jgi:hypothetical protein
VALQGWICLPYDQLLFDHRGKLQDASNAAEAEAKNAKQPKDFMPPMMKLLLQHLREVLYC